MAAIITTPFRIVNARNFKEDVESNNVYIGIGKSDAWSANAADTTDTVEDVPGDHIDDLNQAHENLIGLKKVAQSDISHVVRRINWEAGKTFSPYDSSDPDLYDKDFYCLTSEFKVYKCIQAGSAGSTVQPVHTDASIQRLTDSYHWKYMYTLTTADSEAFLTNSFMPVKTLARSPDLAETDVDYPQQQSQIQSVASSIAAGIHRIVVTNGGSNYTADQTITVAITGDGGTDATIVDADVEIGSDGSITAINVGPANDGKGYTKANITISSSGLGQDATARAVIAPPLGHGVDPISELGGFFIGVNTLLTGNEVTINNDFRQVTVIRNPKLTTGANATATTINPLKYLQATSDVTNFLPDDRIQNQATPPAIAFVAYRATDTDKIYYYQNEKTGYEDFQNGDVISNQGGSQVTLDGSSAVNYNGASDGGPYDIGSGEILFLENRKPINRSQTQIEDIKCIIEF